MRAEAPPSPFARGTLRPRARQALAAVPAFLRRHWLFLVVLSAGAVLRGLVLFAYRPALIRRDSMDYLENALHLQPSEFHPLGYPLFLRLVRGNADLVAIPLAQHLLGLLIAGALYALLLRLGARPWLAALAAAPVLLDAYQLNVEQHILSETVFELCIVAGCVLSLWRRPLHPAAAAAAGLMFAASGLMRTIGVLLIAPAALAALALAAPRWRARAVALVALIGAFALPLAAYATWYRSAHGTYGLSAFGGRFLYGRVAPFADCTRFTVPKAQRPLCPTAPLDQRLGPGGYVWRSRVSPLFHVPEADRDRIGRAFARNVILHQPLTYARTVAEEFLHGFAPTRTTYWQDAPIEKWQFQLTYPLYWGDGLCSQIEHTSRKAARVCASRQREWDTYVAARGAPGGIATDAGLARFLRGYQGFAYVPGPLLAALLLAGIVATLGLVPGRARRSRSGLRAATGLLTGSALVLLIGPVALNEFSWRYEIPAFMLIAPAGILAATLYGAGHGHQREAPGRRPFRPAALLRARARGPRRR